MSHPCAVAALRAAYPTLLPDDRLAAAWVGLRRDRLLERTLGGSQSSLSVSSGCAATGAVRHRRALTEQAGVALQRLDDGSLVDCVRCGRRLDFERLDAAPGVVACAACRRGTEAAPDSRWCR